MTRRRSSARRADCGAPEGRFFGPTGLGAFGHQPRAGRGGARPTRRRQARAAPGSCRWVEFGSTSHVSRAEIARRRQRRLDSYDLESIDKRRRTRSAIAENSAVLTGWEKDRDHRGDRSLAFEPEPWGRKPTAIPAPWRGEVEALREDGGQRGPMPGVGPDEYIK